MRSTHILTAAIGALWLGGTIIDARADQTPAQPKTDVAKNAGASDADGNENHEIATYKIITEIQAVTDNRTRGMSDSLNRPAARLTVTAAHESGLVGYFQAASVSSQVFTNARGVDLTVGGGYRFGDSEALHAGVGLAGEFFPGGSYLAPFQIDPFGNPFDVRTSNYDSQFGVFELGYGDLQGRLLVVLSKDYRGANTGGVCGQFLQVAQFTGGDPTRALNCYARGDHDSRGTLLFDLDYTKPLFPELIPDTTYTLHAGYQKVMNFDEGDFFDFKVGVTHTHWGFDFGLDFLATAARSQALYLVPAGGRLMAINGKTAVFSITRKF